ncbi:MAG TPA: MmgE/PrpD family protein [Bacillota bacterium]|nr:MmgE/PrpD family protein [Bacillota bacterium]
MPGMTEAATTWVKGCSIRSFAPEAVQAAKKGLLDTLAVILAGAREPVAEAAAEVAARLGGAPQSSRIGFDQRTSPDRAALINGAAAHALDFDDTQPGVGGHPSAVIVPAVLAVAEAEGRSGAAILEAYIIGVQVMAKVGRALGHDAYSKGWHNTSVLGPLGAAMACGKLLGLTAAQLRCALGISVSQAGGTRQNFGAMCKPVHAGWAAQAGLQAAYLAAAGVTADEDILEAPMGFFALWGRSGGDIGDFSTPLEIADPGLSVKRHPCCAATHRPLDAVLKLRERFGFGPDDVAALSVEVGPGGLAPLIHDIPANGLQGKFSMRYTVASAVADGRIAIDTFAPGKLRRPEVLALMERISKREAPGATAATVTVELRDGTRASEQVQHPRGSAFDPLTWDEVAAKFRACAVPLVGPEAAEDMIAAVARLDELSDWSPLRASTAR